MVTRSLGKTLIIANPVAHSGRGEKAALFATRFFSSYKSVATVCEVRMTEAPGDATNMAAHSGNYDTIIALGGDGVIHEVASGMMRIPKSDRPRLAVISVGTGNDFARTVGLPKNDPEKSIAELLHGDERVIDIGKVNGTYFVETLSFGIDAAIALDTNERRAKDAKKEGAGLFVTSGIKHVLHGAKGWPFSATIDGEEVEGTNIAFAVQNGPTYGGGFRICPTAVPDDGFLDLCYNTTRPSVPHAMLLFGLIRFGRHTHSKRLTLKKVQHVEVRFTGEEQPPCQVDGNKLVADEYIIDCVPAALRVIVGNACS